MRPTLCELQGIIHLDMRPVYQCYSTRHGCGALVTASGGSIRTPDLDGNPLVEGSGSAHAGTASSSNGGNLFRIPRLTLRVVVTRAVTANTNATSPLHHVMDPSFWVVTPLAVRGERMQGGGHSRPLRVMACTSAEERHRHPVIGSRALAGHS